MSNIFIGFQIFHISKSLFSRTIPDTRSLYQSLPSQQSKQIRLLKLNIKGTIPTDSKKNNQGSAYETCDRACTLPQTTKTLKTHYITHNYIVKMSFRRAAYGTSQFKRFYGLHIIKKLAKENTFLYFIVYFTLVKTIAFPLKHI